MGMNVRFSKSCVAVWLSLTLPGTTCPDRVHNYHQINEIIAKILLSSDIREVPSWYESGTQIQVTMWTFQEKLHHGHIFKKKSQAVLSSAVQKVESTVLFQYRF